MAYLYIYPNPTTVKIAIKSKHMIVSIKNV